PVVVAPPVAPPVVPPPPPLAPPPPPPPPPPRPPRRPAVEVTLGGGVTLGHTPGATGSVAASVGLRWNLVSLALEADHAFLSGAALAGAGEVRASLSSGRLVPCLRQRLGARVDTSACGVLALGALGATAAQVEVARPAAAFYAAVGVRLAARLALSSHLGLRARVDLLGAVTPISLQIRNGAQDIVVWSASPAAFAAGLDFAATFP
ncbi:MAG: hypothetical protein Q8S73_02435, partial [Deltaproteobacteria bacterium]|nr:hypothetical protein [Deltaproteobacteria bacterium]